MTDQEKWELLLLTLERQNEILINLHDLASNNIKSRHDERKWRQNDGMLVHTKSDIRRLRIEQQQQGPDQS